VIKPFIKHENVQIYRPEYKCPMSIMVWHCSFTYLCNTHLAHESIHNVTVTVAGTRQNICRARYAISPVRLSVHMLHGWINQKRLLKIMQFLPYSNPILLVFVA